MMWFQALPILSNFIASTPGAAVGKFTNHMLPAFLKAINQGMFDDGDGPSCLATGLKETIATWAGSLTI